MPRKMFRTERSYGAVVIDYYIDSSGQPYAVEKRYEMRFYGMGDHIGTPGALLETREYPVSFEQIRKDAELERLPAFTEINEKNWADVMRRVPPSVKRKRRRC